MLFVVYALDLKPISEHNRIIKYADDTTLLVAEPRNHLLTLPQNLAILKTGPEVTNLQSTKTRRFK